jgi:hypothetical protein
MRTAMDDSKEMYAAAAALSALTKHGIPPDVQELLVYGNPSRGIEPGALSETVKAILLSLNKREAP